MSNTTSLSDFIIEKKLGKGSFGSVYLVRRKIDNNIYALKQVFFDKLSKRDQENSLNEVRILASIKHPNVIGYKEAFWDDNGLCLNIVMEYADDGDLETKIKKTKKEKGIFTESLIWSYAIQMIEGLKALHNKNIMHRDLKSANIFLIKEKNQCKIGDMNVSKIIKDKVLLTQTGTPFYASPEVWNDNPYSYKSDLWSIGIIIYEMCALKVPFNGKNLDELYKNVCSGKIERISHIYSDDLWKMILMLLQVDVKKRVNCKEFLDSDLIMNKIIEMKENFSECVDIEKNKNSIEGTLLRTIKFKEYEDIKSNLPMNKNYTSEKNECNKNIITNNNINNIYYINYSPDYKKYFPSKFIKNNIFTDSNNVIIHTDINVKKKLNLRKNEIFDLLKANISNINNSNIKNNKIDNYFNIRKHENEMLSKKRPASSTRLITKNNNIIKNIFNIYKNNKSNQSKEVNIYKKNNNFQNYNNNIKKYGNNYKKISKNKKQILKNNSATNNVYSYYINNISNSKLSNLKNNRNNKEIIKNYSKGYLSEIRPLSASPNKRNNSKIKHNNKDNNYNNYNKPKNLPKKNIKEKYEDLVMNKSKSNNKSHFNNKIVNSKSYSCIYNISKNNSYKKPITSVGDDKNMRKINIKAYCNNKILKKQTTFIDSRKYHADNTESELFMMINPIKIKEEKRYTYNKNNVNMTFNENKNNCLKNNLNLNKRKNNNKYSYFELYNNTNSSKNAGSKRKEPVRVLKIFK